MYLASVSSRLLLHDTSSWDLKIGNGCCDGIFRDISWSDDSKYILQVNSAGIVEILSPIDHEVRSLQHIPLKDTWSASFHRDGHRNVAVGTKSGNVKIWDTKMKTITKTFPTPSHPSCVQILSFNANNANIAATMANGDTIIYGTVSYIPVQTVKLACSKSISAMKFHYDSRSLIGFATEEGHVILKDITSNKDKASFKNIHASPVSDIAFSLINKDVMLSSGYDKIIQVYDIRLQKIVSMVKTAHALTSIAINADNQVALGSKNGDVLVYDIRDLNGPLKILKEHNQQVNKVAFQPARKKLLTDISLKEEVETVSLQKIKTPTADRSSDIFFLNDTPPSHNVRFSNIDADNSADKSSFLLTVGLDRSNNFDNNLDLDFVQNSEKNEVRINTERNMTKVSTPINNSAGENFVVPSPLFIPNSTPNGGQPVDRNDNKVLNSNVMDVKLPGNVQAANNLDSKVDELKDYIDLDFGQNSEKNEVRINTERNMTKVSTPINNSAGENFVVPSPLFIPNSTPNSGPVDPHDNQDLNGHVKNIKLSGNVQAANNIDSEVVDDLKYYISDVADENKDYFLHIMMALTKQKLYFEKQFNMLNRHVHKLEQNQNALVEANRTLVLQVEQLKMQQNNIYNNYNP